MTEVTNAIRSTSLANRLVLDSHSLYPKDSSKSVPVDAIHRHLTGEPLNISASKSRLEDLDEAYDSRNIKHARYILDLLTQNEPYFYSSYQNRIKLNQLAHPIQHHLALDQTHCADSSDLTKDIEAIYGQGGNQLEFLLTQSYLSINQDPGLYAEIEGGLSELTIFLLAARNLTDETTNPYLIIPSTEAQDKARITPDGLRHGFDFTVVRERDGVRIPLQVKTRTTHIAHYPEHILVVSAADLVRDNNATPRMLAEALYFEISGAQHADTGLIEAASKRLFNAFDNYQI